MVEIWHEVPGYGGWYEASNQGRIRSWRVPNQPGVRGGSPRILTLTATAKGYLVVGLMTDGRQVQARVNRLVLMTFIGPPFEGAHSCHRNGDSRDNRLENLYWGTAKQNAWDKRRHGTHATGEKVNRSKLKWDQVAEMRRLHASGDFTYADLGRRFRVSKSAAWRAITKKTWEEA